jgi:hypothetical protein
VNYRKYKRNVKYETVNEEVFKTDIKIETEILGAKLFKNGTLVVSPGYQWDGCSGMKGLPFYMDLVPDFEGTMEASLLHDVLCEMMRYGVLDISLVHKANVLFDQEMKRNDFRGHKIYFRAVEKKCKKRIEDSIKDREKIHTKK